MTTPLKESRAWVLVRRSLLLTLVLGFGISLLASGRFNARLIVDGALSFAFVPLSELAGFAVVYHLRRAPLPFAQALPHHVVAVGIETTVDSALDVAAQIAEIHRQGGVAIAAHPGEMFWKGFAPVMDRLDGTEVCHPAIYEYQEAQAVLEQFMQRTSAAAIGSSDFHGPGRLGVCRTFVFARDNSAPAILDAIRARRTVVYGLGGKAYGDPELIRLAAADGRLPAAARTEYPASLLDRLSQSLGLAGLAALIVYSAGRPD